MKLLLILVLVFSLPIINLYSQTSDACITCESNTVNLTKYASAIGKDNTATGIASLAFGFQNTTYGHYSAAIGKWLQTNTNVNNTVIIGTGSSSNNKLVSNRGNSLMVGFNSNVPTFLVTGSAGSGKTGTVGIGNTGTPQAKLHIKADDKEAATVFIEPNSWTTNASASLWLGSSANKITSTYGKGLEFTVQKGYNYVFNDGYVGIGTGVTAPQAKLHIKADDKEAATVFIEPNSWKTNASASLWLGSSANNITSTYGKGLEFTVQKGYNYVFNDGNVGIGTDKPNNRLDVNGNISVNDAIIGKEGTSKWVDPDFLTLLGSNNSLSSKIMIPKGNNPIHQAIKLIMPEEKGEIQFLVGGAFSTIMRQNEVLIGNGEDPMDLKVSGKIWAHEVEVQLGTWWDEVFSNEYQLMDLKQLENFIAANKHLPDMPTEKDVLENGIKIGEMNALQVKKVEELTLYTIQQQKQIDEQKQIVDILIQQIADLKKQLNENNQLLSK